MKKNLSLLILLLFIGVTSAFSDDSTVEITSFRYIGYRTSAAEICGKLSGALPTPAYVKIIVDEHGKYPGIYNVIVGPENRFCTTVSSDRGTASAYLWNSPQNVSVKRIRPNK